MEIMADRYQLFADNYLGRATKAEASKNITAIISANIFKIWLPALSSYFFTILMCKAVHI